MKVKYNRVSTILQTGNRFKADTDHYDMTLLDKVSCSVSFMDRTEAKKLFTNSGWEGLKTLAVGDLVKVPLLEQEAILVSIKGRKCLAQLQKLGALFHFNCSGQLKFFLHKRNSYFCDKYKE